MKFTTIIYCGTSVISYQIINYDILWFWCTTLKSVISHESCKHEILWFWCNNSIFKKDKKQKDKKTKRQKNKKTKKQKDKKTKRQP